MQAIAPGSHVHPGVKLHCIWNMIPEHVSLVSTQTPSLAGPTQLQPGAPLHVRSSGIPMQSLCPPVEPSLVVSAAVSEPPLSVVPSPELESTAPDDPAAPEDSAAPEVEPTSVVVATPVELAPPLPSALLLAAPSSPHATVNTTARAPRENQDRSMPHWTREPPPATP